MIISPTLIFSTNVSTMSKSFITDTLLTSKSSISVIDFLDLSTALC